MIETYRGVVRPHQMDHMGHMNVQWYTAIFDEATWHLFSTLGLTSEYFRSENRGMAALEQKTKYRAEVMAGNLLVCRSTVLEVADKTIRFLHHMYDAEKDTLSATTELTAAHLDREKRKACPLPEFARTKCLEVIGNNTDMPGIGTAKRPIRESRVNSG
ncbi:acyl-CoA thioesterase [Hoeflea sp. TYP-13]|uniref:acyl-CoA thioesterase n=1 Tax=Hoeflea sp. TYP-13 TaxID=3230023 RepID=UPI0034C6A226